MSNQQDAYFEGEAVPLPSLIGRTIVAAEYSHDWGGYQHLVIKLDDGTWVHSWEHSQAGQMRVQINNDEVELPK